MPQIRFTADPIIPDDMVKVWDKYIKGTVHNVSGHEAERWLRRGVAEVVSARVSEVTNVEVGPEPKSEPEPKPVISEEDTPVVSEETVTEENKVEDLGTTISSGNVIPRIPRR
jgi:copper chaperone CopZ